MHRIYRYHHDQSAELTGLRRERPDLLPPAGMNFWCQQAVLRRLDRAFESFFRRCARGKKPGYPRFKSHRRFGTLLWTLKGNAGGVGLTQDGRLRLQGVGCVKVKWHRPLPAEAELGEVSVSRRSRGWHVSICLEVPEPAPRQPTGRGVGVDVGIRCFAALSTNDRCHGPRAGEAASPAVRRAARRVARRRRGSRRRRKAAALLARHRERETNRRRDAAHKLSRELVDAFDLIAHDDLQVRNMLRSARGTLAEPGRNVSAKRALNREIADQGWAWFLSSLAYKAEEAGRRVVKVEPANTSRTCAACGAADARSRRGERFRCTHCGHTDDADVNAAKVVLQRALALLAREDLNRPGRGRQAKTPALVGVA